MLQEAERIRAERKGRPEHHRPILSKSIPIQFQFIKGVFSSKKNVKCKILKIIEC